MKPIAEQCTDKGIAVPVGKTAKEVREMGLEVPDTVKDSWTLTEQRQDVVLLKGAFSNTGYLWVDIPPQAKVINLFAGRRGKTDDE